MHKKNKILLTTLTPRELNNHVEHKTKRVACEHLYISTHAFSYRTHFFDVDTLRARAETALAHTFHNTWINLESRATHAPYSPLQTTITPGIELRRKWCINISQYINSELILYISYVHTTNWFWIFSITGFCHRMSRFNKLYYVARARIIAFGIIYAMHGTCNGNCNKLFIIH